MPTINSHTHCQAAKANATTQALAKSVSVQPHDQNDRKTGRKRTPKR